MVQAIHETGWFTSDYWLNSGNSGGIGISQSGKPSPFTTASGEESAQIHLANLIARSRTEDYLELIPLLPLARGNKGFTNYVSRVINLFSQDFAPDIRKWGDFCTPFAHDGITDYTYAADPEYTRKLLSVAATFPVVKVTAPVEEPTVPIKTYKTNIPGLGEIETSFPISIRIVNGDVYPNVNPQITASTPRVWIQHETGNYSSGANADSEANYLNSGADGREASYHFSVDDTHATCMIPVNFLTWQAADGFWGPGNRRGISCELAVGQQIISDPKRKQKSRDNAAELAAVVSEKAGVPTTQKSTRHYDWNAGTVGRHYCPELMMSENYWPTFVSEVERIRELVRSGKWLSGDMGTPDVPVPPKTYTKPVVLSALDKYLTLNDPDADITFITSGETDFVYVHDIYQATVETPRMAWSDIKEARREGSKNHAGEDMNPGEKAVILFTFRAADGEIYGYSAYATRFYLKDFKRVED